MTDFEKWSTRYKNNGCTKENLQDLVELRVLTYDEYTQITGENIIYTVNELKAKKVAYIDNYKHEKRMYFPYGNCGGVQRFNESTDLPFMQITLEGLNRGMVTSIDWKYSNGLYDHVEMPQATSYIENMILIGGLLISLSFTIERIVVEQINTISTTEELLAFNEKQVFDALFEVERDKIIQGVLNPQV